MSGQIHTGTESTLGVVHRYIDPAYLELSRNRAEYARIRVIENLEKSLLEFESKAVSKQMKIAWCPEEEDFLNELEHIAQATSGHQLTFIPPPAPDPFDHTTLLRTAKEKVRQSGTPANKHAVFCVADYIIAETGHILLSSADEALLHASGSELLVVIAPIKNIARTNADAEHLMLMRNVHAGRTSLNRYMLTIRKNTGRSERKHAREIVVLLVENHVTPVLESKELRSLLYCIECGACERSSAVTAITQKEQYPFSPIQNLLPAYLTKHKTYNTHSIILNKAGTQVCPVNIDLDRLYLRKRQDLENTFMHGAGEKLFKAAFRRAILNRKFMNQGSKMKQFIMQNLLPKQVYKTVPEFASKTFNELWKEQK